MGLLGWIKATQEAREERNRHIYTENDIIKGGIDMSKEELAQAAMDVFLENHPEFKSEGKSTLQLVPCDGNELRMQLYGLYKGDKIFHNGTEVEITKNEQPKLSFKLGKTSQEIIDTMPDEVTVKSLFAKMYLGHFNNGDRVSDGIIEYTYDDKIMGMHAKCIETQKPLKDIVMPDVVAGMPVNSLEECFKDCKNVASVTRIPPRAKLYHCFAGSGIRVLPDNLDASIDDTKALYRAFNILNSVEHYRKLYEQNPRIFGVETIIYDCSEYDPYDYKTDSGCSMYYLLKNEKELQRCKDIRDNMNDFLKGKSSFIQSAGTVEFIEKYDKQEVCRVKIDGSWHIYNPDSVSFTDYSVFMGKEHKDAQLFPDTSFKEGGDAARHSVESILEQLNKRIDKLEKSIALNVAGLEAKIYTTHMECKKAQGDIVIDVPDKITVSKESYNEIDEDVR